MALIMGEKKPFLACGFCGPRKVSKSLEMEQGGAQDIDVQRFSLLSPSPLACRLVVANMLLILAIMRLERVLERAGEYL